MVLSQPYIKMHVKTYPVFKPNEYFWANHWKKDSGEERWEAYARVMREIMSKSFNFGLSDLAMEDKFQYKYIMKPKKGQKMPERSSKKGISVTSPTKK